MYSPVSGLTGLILSARKRTSLLPQSLIPRIGAEFKDPSMQAEVPLMAGDRFFSVPRSAFPVQG